MSWGGGALRVSDACLGLNPREPLKAKPAEENGKLDHEEGEGMPLTREQGEVDDELWVWRRKGHGWQRRFVGATDASCTDQQMPARFRRSAAALFVDKGHAMNCSIKLKTKAQGAQRAEIKCTARWAA